MQSSSSAKGDSRRSPPRCSWHFESGMEAGALSREGEVFGLAADRKRPLHALLFRTEPHCCAGSGMSGPFLKVGVRSAKTWDCFIFDSNSHKRIGIAIPYGKLHREQIPEPVCNSSRSDSRKHTEPTFDPCRLTLYMVCLDSSAIGAESDRSLGLPNGHYRQRVDSKASSRTSHLPNPITLVAPDRYWLTLHCKASSSRH